MRQTTVDRGSGPDKGLKVVPTESPGGKLRIWDWPDPQRRYVIGADPAENRVRDRAMLGAKATFNYLDDRPDYSAAIVLDMESAKHVATWHGYEDPGDWAVTLAAMGYLYNTALIVPENNSIGNATLHVLVRNIRYPAVYRSRQFNVVGGGLTQEWGWRTSGNNRSHLLRPLQDLYSSRVPFTRDEKLVEELRTMQNDERGEPRAKGKDKDDLVFAMALALQGRNEYYSGTLIQQAQAKPLTREQMVWAKVQQRKAAFGNRSPHPLRRGGRGLVWRDSPARPGRR